MKPTRRVLYALLLAAAGSLGACDRTDGLGDLTGPTTPQHLLESTIDGVTGTLSGSKRVEVLKRQVALNGDVTYVSEPISRWGGVLKFGNHKLVVPAGAVLFPTRFSATVRAGTEIRLDMRASNDYGAVTQFLVPVQLTINVSDSNAGDLTGTAIYYVNPAGGLEQMPSTVDNSNRNVTGYLNHFSDYIPGTLRTQPTGDL